MNPKLRFHADYYPALAQHFADKLAQDDEEERARRQSHAALYRAIRPCRRKHKDD